MNARKTGAGTTTARSSAHSMDFYTGLFESAPAGYFLLNQQGRIILLNRAGSLLLGGDPADLPGLVFASRVAPQSRVKFQGFLKSAFSSRAIRSCQIQLQGVDGQSRQADIHCQSTPDGRECMAVVLDTTERSGIEEGLRVSEIRYRRLFEAAHDGVLLLDPETRKITDANPFIARLLDYPRAELIGRELFEIGLLADEAQSRRMFRELKKKHEIRYEDLPLKSRTGRQQEVEVVANLYLENGQRVIQCNIRDISERKKAETLARRNEAMFSGLLALVPIGVYVLDEKLRMIRINPCGAPSFSTIKSPVGRDFQEIVRKIWPARVADVLLRQFRKTLQTGEASIADGFSARRIDSGIMEACDWQAHRIMLPSGHLGLVCFFQDITERKKAEADRRRLAVLNASNTKLEEENARRLQVEKSLRAAELKQARLLEQSRQMEAQLRWLSRRVLHTQEEERKRISRELHDVVAQTLAGINIRLATLKKQAELDTKGLARNILLAQRLVEKSVDTIHKFARELRPAVLDDLGLIPALHAFLKTFASRTGIVTRLSAFREVEELDGEKRTALYRIAQEAIINVGTHARASRVEVTIQKVDSFVQMEVRDDGKSFDVEHALSIKSGKRLGLIGMRERVEMLGGRFAMESKSGIGTTVKVQIPAGQPRSASGPRFKPGSKEA